MENNLEPVVNYLINQKINTLSNKPHLQKYLEIRKNTDSISNKMLEYFKEGNYNFDDEFSKISKILYEECTYINENISLNWKDDKDILLDMLLFKNSPNVNCMVSEFLSKKLYEDEEEKRILECMLKSTLSIYKVLKRHDNGFIEIQDLITKKRIRIVDIAGSLEINEDIYMVNRIISYNGISFGNGISLITNSSNREIDNYLKKNINNKSKITVIMELRSIIKRQNSNFNRNFIPNYYN